MGEMSDRNGKNRDYLRTLIIVAFIGALAGVIGDALGIFPYLFPREDRFKSQDSGSHSHTVLSLSRLEKKLSDTDEAKVRRWLRDDPALRATQTPPPVATSKSPTQRV